LSVEINNIIINLVIKSWLTWRVDPGLSKSELKKIEKGLIQPNLVKNLGQPEIKHESKTCWLFET
jgi:hypothetical protein